MNDAPHSSDAVPLLSPDEQRLLLACARTRRTDEHDRQIRQLTPAVRWDCIVRSAWRHNLIPLIHRSLCEIRPAGLPADLLASLRESAFVSAHNTLGLTRELLCILAAFEAAHLPVLPFKGAVLAAAAYGCVASRTFNDIDLLVRPADAPAAARLLHRLGFADWGIGPDREKTQLDLECEHAFVRPDGVMVDLHWRLSRRHFPFPLEFDELWNRRERVLLLPTLPQAPTLSPADALQVVCMHAAKHSWERLAWVCDVAELLSANPAMPWQFVISESHRLGSTRMLLLGLELARRFLSSALPPQLRSLIRNDRDLPWLIRQIHGQWVREQAVTSGIAASVRQCLFHLRMRPGMHDRLQYCLLAAAPTTRDVYESSLPRSLHFLHYVTRPVRLLVRRLQRAA